MSRSARHWHPQRHDKWTDFPDGVSPLKNSPRSSPIVVIGNDTWPLRLFSPGTPDAGVAFFRVTQASLCSKAPITRAASHLTTPTQNAALHGLRPHKKRRAKFLNLCPGLPPCPCISPPIPPPSASCETSAMPISRRGVSKHGCAHHVVQNCGERPPLGRLWRAAPFARLHRHHRRPSCVSRTFLGPSAPSVPWRPSTGLPLDVCHCGVARRSRCAHTRLCACAPLALSRSPIPHHSLFPTS